MELNFLLLKLDARPGGRIEVTMVPSIGLLDSKGAYRGIKFNGIWMDAMEAVRH